MNNPRTNQVPNLSVAILAGGQGARLDGQDKGLLVLNGRPLIENTLQQLGTTTNHYLISANRHHDIYSRYGHPVIADLTSDFAGPLAGVCACLLAVRTEWVLFVPVDAVRLPAQFAQRMCEAAHQQGASTVVAHDGVSIIPVAFLLHQKLFADVQTTYSQGERSLQRWLRQQGAVELHFDDQPPPIWSVNTPEELAAAERHLRQNAP